MADLEAQLGSILQDPEMMGKIMSFAQSLGGSDPPPPPQPKESPGLPEIDMQTVQRIASIMGNSGIDRHQQALLQALSPYLSHQRISKLEKAMRAAKMAGMAGSFFNSNGR